MGKHVGKGRLRSWASRHWEAMLILIPVAGMAVVASIIAATNI
jgi:hypothetical protein